MTDASRHPLDAPPIVCPGCERGRPGRDSNSAYECCNPACGGLWGTGCYHCHHPRFFVYGVIRSWSEARGQANDHGVSWLTKFSVMTSLAAEIDDRWATRTGREVCRQCGGRGEFAHWGRHRRVDGFDALDYSGAYAGSERSMVRGMTPRVQIVEFGDDDHGDRRRWTWTYDCPCDGPTRPETACLTDVVDEAIASRALGETPGIPGRWLVDLDAMEAAGWEACVLPSTLEDQCRRRKWWTSNGVFDPRYAVAPVVGSPPVRWKKSPHRLPRTTPAWVCRWWRAFRDWALAGHEPDDEALARDLRRLR